MQHNHVIRQPRGSALVLGFAMVIVLMSLAMVFASRMSSSQLRSESDIAGERCYELAQTANTLKVNQLWVKFKSQPSALRISWLGGEDLNGNGKLDKNEDANGNGILDLEHADADQDSDWVPNDSGSTCTRIKMLSMLQDKWVLVRFTTWARVKDERGGFDVVRKVQRVVRYSNSPSSVFDFVYFATNYGVIDGTKITLHGSIGANGDLAFQNNPKINGKIYAAANLDTNAQGQIQGKADHDSFSTYQSLAQTNPLLRPMNPAAPPEDKNKNGVIDPGEDTNHNGLLDNFRYDLGYDGTQPALQGQALSVMPQLDNLDIFRNYTNSYTRPTRPDLGEVGGVTGGIVKQLIAPGLDPTNPLNYQTLIDKTYGDNGEIGFKANVSNTGITYSPMLVPIEPDPLQGWKNGNVALVGTPQQPLVIFGPVVITNDLVIKGTVTGQGTFFVGRNTHIVGDVTYNNPPQWTPNDINFDTTVAVNKTKDAVGFGSRGNIILGDYTLADNGLDQWPVAKTYMTPPYTKPQSVTNFSDDEIGYGDGKGGPGNGNGSGNGNGKNHGNSANAPGHNKNKQPTFGTFPGDYTYVDGDKYYLDNGTVPLTPNRAYYQSTFSKAYITSIATKPKTMHGFYYAGHLIGGRADTLNLFGSLIAYDEGILSDNSTTFIYDPRISQIEPKSYVNLFMPQNAAVTVIYQKDLTGDTALASSPDW